MKGKAIWGRMGEGSKEYSALIWAYKMGRISKSSNKETGRKGIEFNRKRGIDREVWARSERE